MFKQIIPITALIIIGIAITASALSETERSDCPGKIICPITGDLVCKDKCPLGIEETQTQEDQQAQLPACCRKD